MFADLHADTPLLMRWLNYDLLKRHRAPLPGGALFSHLDLPRAKTSGLALQLFGLVSLPFERDGYGTVNAMIDGLEETSRRSKGEFAIAHSGKELGELGAGTKPPLIGMLSLEGVHCLDGDMARAQALVKRGVVSFGLCHFSANAAGAPSRCLGRDDFKGLSSFGHELVDYLSANQCLIDVAHLGPGGFNDVMNRRDVRVLCSHTGLSGVYPHWRNLSDDQVRAIAGRGGVIGVIFSRHFLGGSNIEQLVRHVVHLVNVGGQEVAALGSDFDGCIVPVRGLRDVSKLSRLRDALLDVGLGNQTVDGIVGDNARRFLSSPVAI